MQYQVLFDLCYLVDDPCLAEREVLDSRIQQNRLRKNHEVLKTVGFCKNGSTFSSENKDVVQFVQLQSSSKTTSAKLVTTMNLGIFSRTVAAGVGKHEAAKYSRVDLQRPTAPMVFPETL